MATDTDVSLQTKLHHFIGTWKLETSENFEEYMKAVGMKFGCKIFSSLIVYKLL